MQRELKRMFGTGFIGGLALIGVLLAPTAPGAQSMGVQETTRSVKRALERLPYYGVFDFMAFGVDRGTVTLMGYTYNGSLKSAAERATKRASGVDDVANRLEVLPSSPFDDRIRWATFYKIYADASLSRYAPGGVTGTLREAFDARKFPGLQPLGAYPIHIIVKNGRTTLAGVVDNSADKQIAEMRAREVTGVFNVENDLTVAGGATTVRSHSADVPLAPELTGLGTLHVPVTTSVPGAQRFFDQGMRLLYAFNHTEAIRAFREAARLDPGLAMAYWGEALALGPNLNAPMTPDNGRLAYAAIQQAMEKRSLSSSRERALIKALATRYAADGGGDRSVLNRAYAAAMETVAARFAGDPDAGTLYADAQMNTMPWDYWQKDGSPKAETARVLAMLESIIARNPDHAGALHYHIHVLEASADPDRAERSADRLGSLMPAAGHMVHMPAHIYIRVGRYADAAEANELAIRADEDYLSQCQAQGLYPVSYYPHNLHFLWAAATLEGRKAAAVEAARKVAAKVPHHHAGALAWTADFPVTPMLAYARFGLWQEALTEPPPPAQQPYATGIWHYARGRAFIARNQLDRAASELTALKSVMQHEAFSSTLKDLPLLTNLQIASRVVEGELAVRREGVDHAIRVLREAVAIEDGLPYSEPPIWHQPTRHVLGAVLLEAGRPAEAEEVYREDLKIFRENGWSLFGLMESLKAQLHRGPEAAEIERRFEKAWGRADIELISSAAISR